MSWGIKTYSQSVELVPEFGRTVGFNFESISFSKNVSLFEHGLYD